MAILMLLLIILGLLFGYITGRIAYEELKESKRYFFCGLLICIALGISVGLGSYAGLGLGILILLIGILLRSRAYFIPVMYAISGGFFAFVDYKGIVFFFLAGFPAGSILLEEKKYKSYLWSVLVFIIMAVIGITLKSFLLVGQ